jgi:hypothetical protein
MPEEITHPDGRIEQPQVKYEKTDASFGAIVAIILGALVFAAFVHYVILLFFFDIHKHEAQRKESSHPQAPTAEQLFKTLPRQPVLEEVDRRAGIQSNDNYKRQVKRELRLDSYGTTEEQGFVHIPIDRAIELMGQEGQRLKSRPPPTSAEEKKRYEEQRRRSGGLVDYGESNSGRMFRRGRQK